MPTLFQECVDILEAKILTLEEEKHIIQQYKKLYPLTIYQKVNWEDIAQKIFVGKNNPEGIIPALQELLGKTFDYSIYIEWDSGLVAIIHTELYKAVQHFWDIDCVAPNKVMFNLTEGYIIEIRSWRDINVGIVPKPNE